MIKGIKANLYKKKLELITRNFSSSRKTSQNPFKNVLLFFDATDGAERKVIQKYVTKLERSGKVVKLFAFVNTKDPDLEPGINHYVNRDINWYQVPENEDLQVIQSKKYDVLISLIVRESAHHLFVIRSMNAAMKIGPFAQYGDELIFDISVDHEPSLGIPELIKNINSCIQLLSND